MVTLLAYEQIGNVTLTSTSTYKDLLESVYYKQLNYK